MQLETNWRREEAQDWSVRPTFWSIQRIVQTFRYESFSIHIKPTDRTFSINGKSISLYMIDYTGYQEGGPSPEHRSLLDMATDTTAPKRPTSAT